MTRSFRYYDLILGAFVAVLLCSNLIGPAKVVMLDLPWLGPTQFGAGNLFFPLSYLFGDILTEVYGYALARRVIWTGFAALIFATVMTWVILAMPASPSEPFNLQLQPALVTCFGGGWRIAMGSLIAFCIGDFLNSYVLAKLKVKTKGQHAWLRFTSSTIVGQAVDSLIFYPLAFAGIWSGSTLVKVMLTNWGIKVLVEFVMLPLTYWVCQKLKQAEGVDAYDEHTDFNPFSLKR
ncbi:MAG: queuosine precursor transporter [Verrucomicrobia bacterium]|nr:queuosine precursor transporter [Verrucomicrobiota bacterium]